MAKFLVSTAVLALLSSGGDAFQASFQSPRSSARPGSVSLDIVSPGSDANILEKLQQLLDEETAPKVDEQFDAMVKSIFPGAINNVELESAVVEILAEKGYNGQNTLLATSLCCDELARILEDDFVKVYGNNFNLGGLAGFPFAGNTGFGAMSAHIPDDGYCLVVYGPHVGVTKDGVVGKVERPGIELVDTCCGSAVAASNYLSGITDGGATITTKIQTFSDFQQDAVKELILPHGKRLADAEDRMRELPYALFDSQDLLVQDIVQTGAGGTKKGLAILGGIQINTGPDTLDYFHPLRFDYMNSKGELVEDLLPKLAYDDQSNFNGFSGEGGSPELADMMFAADPVNN